MSKEPRHGLSVRIDGHRYYAREWYGTKREAQVRALILRAQSHLVSVRVIKRLVGGRGYQDGDIRRYVRYWVFTR